MKPERLGIVGAGVMGRAIAQHWCSFGYDTVLVDTHNEPLERAEPSPHLTCSTDLTQVANCDLVLEAVFEDLEVKSALLRGVPPVPILATNTSSLTVAALAEAVRDKTRFVALHYNNPAETNPIVELVPGENTQADVVDTCRELLANTHKRCVLCKDEAGFALNRQSLPYVNEAGRLLDDGVGSPTAIDRVATEVLGTGLGPFAVMNLVGTRVVSSAIRNLAHHGALYEPAQSIQTLGETNAQFRLDDSGHAEKTLVETRLLGAIFVAALEITANGIASAEDLDAICVEALGYPQGSITMMRERGVDAAGEVVDQTCERFDMASLSLELIR